MSFLNKLQQEWGKLDRAWRFAITIFLVARLFYAIWSWVILTIQPIAVHYITENDKPATIFLSLQSTNAYAYFRTVNGETLSFRSANKDTVFDLQTNSTWDISTGVAIDGQLKGVVLTPTQIPPDMFPYHDSKVYPNAWVALWQRFDANWYTSIAENGYGRLSGDTAFPPLYPLLLHILKPIFGDTFITGLVVSHIFTLYMLKLLYDLFVEWGDPKSARWSLVLMLIYPTSFFLFSAYSEPLFLVLALLSMRSMKTGSWPWAGFWIFCTILERLQGIALFFPMLYLIWKDHPYLHKSRRWLSVIIGSSGFLFYLYFRSRYTENNLIFSYDQAWHSHLTFPWTAYINAIRYFLIEKSNYIDILNLAVTTIFIFLIIKGWQTIPLEYNLYSLFSLLVLSTRVVDKKPLNAMLRYSLTLFPSFFIIGMVSNNRLKRRLVVYLFIALNLYLSANFFGWGWVA